MSYYSPYFPDILANVPTDNPWLLAQMTYNTMPNRGPQASLDSIFQEAAQHLGQGGVAPSPEVKPSQEPARRPETQTESSAPSTEGPSGTPGVSGALTGRGAQGLNAFGTLASPFTGGYLGPNPFSAMSFLGQTFAPTTTVNPSAAPAGSSLASLGFGKLMRSEEHTSELQSLRHLVCRLLLEKK